MPDRWRLGSHNVTTDLVIDFIAGPDDRWHRWALRYTERGAADAVASLLPRVHAVRVHRGQCGGIEPGTERPAQPTTPPACDCPDTDGTEPDPVRKLREAIEYRRDGFPVHASHIQDRLDAVQAEVDRLRPSELVVNEGGPTPWATYRFDPNVRVRGVQTYTGYEDRLAGEPPRRGKTLRLVETESGMTVDGVVTETDDDKQLIYVAVDWSRLRTPDGAEPAGSAVGQRGAPTRDEVWVSGNPDGPWRRASDIGRDEVVDDQELFRWIERVLKEMVKAAVPAMVLTYRDEQDRRARMHVSMGQLRRLWTLAAVRDDDGGEMGRKITALANAAGIDRDDLDWEDALGCVTVILDALRAKAGGTANDLVAPAVTLRVGAAGSVAPDLSRIARALGVSLDPDDPDPVGRLVEAAGKAREVEVVSESDELIVAQYTDTENLPGWQDMVADLRAIGKPPIVSGEYARTKLPAGSWVASLADDGTVQLDSDGQPWPLHRADHLGNTRRTRERSFVVVYRAPAPAPAALAVGDEVTGDRAVTAPVGTKLGAKNAAVAAVHTNGGWSVTGMNREADHEHVVRINEWVVLVLGGES